MVKHEFLMATLVVSTHMYGIAIGRPSKAMNEEVEKNGPEIEAVLRKSYEIWSQNKTSSTEAAKMSNLLNILFRKLEEMRAQKVRLSPSESETQVPLVQETDLMLPEEFNLMYHLQDMNGLFGDVF